MKKVRGLGFNITVSNFVPKPHTPMQWVARADDESLSAKKDYLAKHLPGKVRFHDMRASGLEAAFARGE